MTTGQTPAHDRVCLIVDPPEQPVPIVEFRALHASCGTAMTAFLLGVTRQSVLQRLHGRAKRKPTPRAMPEQQSRARLWAIELRVTALEVQMGLVWP